MPSLGLSILCTAVYPSNALPGDTPPAVSGPTCSPTVTSPELLTALLLFAYQVATSPAFGYVLSSALLTPINYFIPVFIFQT